MEPILILPLLMGFFACFFLVPIWIKKAKNIGLIWEDMNKPGHPKNVAGSGGIVVIMAFILGILSYIAIITFYFKDNNLINIFALLTTIIIASMIGFVDDLFGWVHGGLSAKFRIFLLIFAAIPLSVINAGNSTMIGIQLGLLYPLVLIPLGIIGAAATFNFLAGYNGLEASQGIIILSALAFVCWVIGESWLALIALIMVFCLFAFYIFNKYPAKIFPGDVLTYGVGAMIAIIAILGNIEKIAVFFFIPYIIETCLKIRGKLKKQSLAKVNKDGDLEMPYEKIYGLEHLAIYLLKKMKKNGKVKEREVVYFINLFQILVILIGLALFKNSIF
ncbi:MAG: glycosyl transferase family 4 [Nanoarchaeota archaeon]